MVVCPEISFRWQIVELRMYVYVLRLSKRKGTKAIGVVESTTSIEVDSIGSLMIFVSWVNVMIHNLTNATMKKKTLRIIAALSEELLLTWFEETMNPLD